MLHGDSDVLHCIRVVVLLLLLQLLRGIPVCLLLLGLCLLLRIPVNVKVLCRKLWHFDSNHFALW